MNRKDKLKDKDYIIAFLMYILFSIIALVLIGIIAFIIGFIIGFVFSTIGIPDNITTFIGGLIGLCIGGYGSYLAFRLAVEKFIVDKIGG